MWGIYLEQSCLVVFLLLVSRVGNTVPGRLQLVARRGDVAKRLHVIGPTAHEYEYE